MVPTGARMDQERRMVYTACMAYADRITIEPGKRSGKPCIRGMRMTVYDVLEYLASGMTQKEILEDFPCLEAADLRTCLQFAADRERKIVTIPPEYELDVRYTARMAYAERITIEPGEFGSKAYFRGMRVTVIDVLESLGEGMTKEQVLARFPDLEAADIQACLEYAADRERKMVTVPRG